MWPSTIAMKAEVSPMQHPMERMMTVVHTSSCSVFTILPLLSTRSSKCSFDSGSSNW
jgi:hypothetical protein